MAKKKAALGTKSKGFKELRDRILFVLGAFVLFRVGSHIPVPGVNPEAVAALFEQTRGSIVDVFNMFSGGALSRLSILALGVMPYISASIIMQMLSAVVPKLEQLKKEGEQGRRVITKYTRYGTLVLAVFQSIGIGISVAGQQVAGAPVVVISEGLFLFVACVSVTGGTMFLVWLGEQITERGLGNGISLLIFASIVSGLPGAISGTLELTRTGQFTALGMLALFIGAIMITAFVVFVERGQRRLRISYAQRQALGGRGSHLPLKINMAGVIPPIFASAIILFPASLGSWLSQDDGMEWLRELSTSLAPGQPIYVMLYAALIIFFCFFYTALVFNPKDISDNLKRSGAFIPGVRPGAQTTQLIDRVVSRLTLSGAAYLTFVCLIPEFLIVYYNVPFYFGGTSLLIIVVVMMDSMSQVQSYLVSRQYENLIKKAGLTGSLSG